MGDVSIQEAAMRLGVSTETIRRRLHKRVLKGRQETTPQGFVWTVELPEDLQGQPEHGDPYADLREMVATLKEELASKNSQIEQLHVLLQQQARALPSPNEKNTAWWQFWRR